ncbi:MAG: hypothetical protein ACLUGW_01160 [Oscillospiraceae bacterium]
MRKLVASVIAGTIVVSCLAPGALASYELHEAQNMQYEEIQPRYEILGFFTALLSISDDGRASCQTTVYVQTGYRAELTAELQQSNGKGWTTIHSWHAEGSRRVEIIEPKFVTSGHSYRLKVTATAYDSNGNIVEEPIKYSSVENY